VRGAWRLDRTQRLGWVCVAIGLALALLIQAGHPLPSPPLYDGVLVVEPYVWLDAPPGQLSGANGASATIPVEDGLSDPLAVATSETPPQLQLLASSGGLRILRTATSITVQITPIHSRPAPTGSYIDGNTYRVDVTDQAGNAITAPASAYVSLILRPADPTLADATIERFDGQEWQVLQTDSAGAAGFFAIVTEFGEFALVASGVSPYPTLAGTDGAPSGSVQSPPPEGAPHEGAPPGGAPPGGPASVLLGVAFVTAGLIVLLARRRRARYELPAGWGR
jgi:hypothetical protein